MCLEVIHRSNESKASNSMKAIEMALKSAQENAKSSSGYCVDQSTSSSIAFFVVKVIIYA